MANQKVSKNMANNLEISYAIANDLRLKTVVLLKGASFPCKVMELHRSAPGKHGSAKIRVIGIDIFSGKKHEDIFGSDEQVTVPIVKKSDWQVQFILDDGYLKLLNLKTGMMREDIKLPQDDPEIAEKIQAMYLESEEDDKSCVVVTVLSAMNQDKICGAKTELIKLNQCFP